MKRASILIALFIVYSGVSQTTLVKSSIDNGGATEKAGTTQILYTIGESVVQEQSNGNGHLSEGFISPKLLRSVGVKEFYPLEGVSVYPNPTIDFINISSTEDVVIQIYDYKAKLLITKSSQGKNRTTIDLSKYRRGIYIVTVKNKEKAEVFKIVKN